VVTIHCHCHPRGCVTAATIVALGLISCILTWVAILLLLILINLVLTTTATASTTAAIAPAAIPIVTCPLLPPCQPPVVLQTGEGPLSGQVVAWHRAIVAIAAHAGYLL
jgi:hypothetical protein